MKARCYERTTSQPSVFISNDVEGREIEGGGERRSENGVVARWIRREINSLSRLTVKSRFSRWASSPESAEEDDYSCRARARTKSCVLIYPKYKFDYGQAFYGSAAKVSWRDDNDERITQICSILSR